VEEENEKEKEVQEDYQVEKKDEKVEDDFQIKRGGG